MARNYRTYISFLINNAYDVRLLGEKKMRLIDADKLRINCVCLNGICVDGRTIENAPTVKAIPIEWILNYRKNNQGEITYYTIDAIDHMLCEWCKRNNIDMWDMIDSWETENEID